MRIGFGLVIFAAGGSGAGGAGAGAGIVGGVDGLDTVVSVVAIVAVVAVGPGSVAVRRHLLVQRRERTGEGGLEERQYFAPVREDFAALAEQGWPVQRVGCWRDLPFARWEDFEVFWCSRGECDLWELWESGNFCCDAVELCDVVKDRGLSYISPLSVGDIGLRRVLGITYCGGSST